MSVHIPVHPALQVEACFAHVEGFLQQHDTELRLRRSAERPQWYVLERRCRRRSCSDVGLRDNSDLHIQRRDGYVHVSLVHPQWMTRPWNIMRALLEEGVDTFATSAHTIANDLEYEEKWAKESRRRRRLGLYRDMAVDAYDVLSRMGNKDGTERTRIAAPGPVSRGPIEITG